MKKILRRRQAFAVAFLFGAMLALSACDQDDSGSKTTAEDLPSGTIQMSAPSGALPSPSYTDDYLKSLESNQGRAGSMFDGSR